MIDTTVPIAIHVGFLTVFSEGAGFLGGYLVTNSWGRPLEFRLSTAVQPNRVQQILYGNTLTEYVCVDLIGKTLVEKAATPIHLLVTDSADVLPIRSQIEVPIIAAIPDNDLIASLTHPRSSVPLVLPPEHANDEETVRALLDRLDAALDLAEPFTRIREAMTEARKMGVTSRAA
ncbi:MAG TPA: hypothetical protein VKD71_07345 [Gemmataceae bacterium]|nr:hypothetical protein [Gemmataceae bacterium]